MALDVQTGSHGSTASTAAMCRRELFIWLLCVLAAHYFLHFLRANPHADESFIEALGHSLASRSVFHYLGWYAAFQLVVSAAPGQPASRFDIGFVLIAALLPFVPANSPLWLSMTATAIYLVAATSATKLRAAGIVLLALAFNGFWGPKVFEVFAFPLLTVDTALVGGLLSLLHSGYSWQGTMIESDGHGVVIFGPCSSFHNISLGLLCWIAITKLSRPGWAPGDAWIAVMVVAAVLVLNTARVFLIALSTQMYAYWHSGFGADLFALVTSAAVIAISVWGALRRVRG
jgi:hypothetical protein